MKTLTINELRQVFERIVSKIEFEYGNDVAIETDLYRFIPADKWTTFSEDKILIGSLADDINSLKKLVQDSGRPCTFVDLDRLASVLHAISQERNPS